MSIVADHVRRLDAQVDQISLSPLESDYRLSVLDAEGRPTGLTALSSPRVDRLLSLVKNFSTASSSHTLLSSSRIQNILTQSGLASEAGIRERQDGLVENQYESEVEWLLVSKATVQVYGLILNTLLDQIIPLSDDLWYWDQVLASHTYSGLYTVQISPLRVWKWTAGVYRESRLQLSALQQSPSEVLQPSSLVNSVSRRWDQFYSIVRRSVAERSVLDFHQKVLSPIARSRSEIRENQARLRHLRETVASGLGVLLDEGLRFGFGEDDAKSDLGDYGHEWKGVLGRSVALMDMVLGTTYLDISNSDFEDKVFAGVEEDLELSVHLEDASADGQPAVVVRRLLSILDTGIPNHISGVKEVVGQHGRPSKLVRYWLPASLLLFSSSAILRILANRKADILNWIQDLGSTARDFWFNWVIDPIRKIVGTIRHDTNSEIAIMSRESLKADRDSLERMVVDFALEKPDLAAAGASSLTDAQIADIRTKVKEGDVTPVLKAYEKDLRKPFVGAVKGDLVRALLIQVQKTKVDLEVAISGIDALLKSQELVFGFVGLTPGGLVLIATLQYIRTLSGGRKGMRRSQQANRSIRILRNIDRIFSEATPAQEQILPYKDYGLLVCEVHVLRKLVHGLLPGDVEKEFLEDLDYMVNVKGIPAQTKALERIRWAYGKWLK